MSFSLLRPWLLSLSFLWLAGCLSQGPTVIVPIQKNADEQFAYAQSYQANQKIDLIRDESRYLRARAVVTETYRKVGEFFPDDRKFTPLAKLEVIIMECGFDSPRYKLEGYKMRRQLNKAIEQLSALSRQYPEYKYVQAMTLYQRGQCHRQLGDYERAQKCFKGVMDTFAGNQDTSIKSLVDMARLYYNQVYTE